MRLHAEQGVDEPNPISGHGRSFVSKPKPSTQSRKEKRKVAKRAITIEP
jgi:hypothetical protein